MNFSIEQRVEAVDQVGIGVLNEMTLEKIRDPMIVCSSISSTSGQEQRKRRAEENSKVSQTV